MTDTASALRVTGHGELRSRLERSLAGPGAPRGARVTVVDSDDHTDLFGDADLAERSGVVFLPVRADRGHVFVGPGVWPNRAGCVRCIDPHPPSADDRPATTPPWSGLAVDLVTELVRAQLTPRLPDGPRAGPDCAVLVLELDRLTVSRHPLLARSRCPRCRSHLVAPGPAGPSRTPVPAVRGTLRARDGLTEESLTAAYLDPVVGIVGHLERSRGPEQITPLVTAPIRLADTGTLEHGVGRTLDYRGCRVAALAEALERLGGVRRPDPDRCVRGSYAQLADVAVDPRTFGLYPDGWYDRPGWRFPRFDPGAARWWTRGRSCARGEVLVPREFAHYGPVDPAEPPLAPDTSNGCAVGSCWEEAVLHGLLEVVERDAFLVTWFAGLPVTPIALESVPDRRVALVADRIADRSGYRVTLLDTTLEHGIPSCWALATDLRRRTDRPRVLCAASAHDDPRRMALGAVLEIGSVIPYAARMFDAQRERAARVAADPDQVRAMDDHLLRYGHPRGAERVVARVSATAAAPFPDRYGDVAGRPPVTDLRAALEQAVSRMARCGLDVVVVDQTTPEHAAGGLVCVRVLVPGTVPMVFGHRYRRIAGLPRLLAMPELLGVGERLSVEDLSDEPHPFP